MFKKFKNKISELFRKIRNKLLRKKLLNKNLTIIANNCNATFMYKDLGIKYNSPTINLFMSINDFVKFCENMDYYVTLKIEEINDSTTNYPVGRLGDLQINFMHYKSFNLAKVKWQERCRRINNRNICIIMNEGKGSTYDLLKRFDNLKYNNKVMLTHKEYPEFKSAYYIKGFEEKETCDFLFKYQNIFAKRFYEQFNYITFFNNMIK